MDSLFQIPCATLHEVINALVEKTAGTLQPFLLEEPYEENISEENLQHKDILKIYLLSSFKEADHLLFCLCHQHMFLPMMRMEKGSSTLPPPAPCQRLLPCLQNKVCLGHKKQHADTRRQTEVFILAFLLVQIAGPAAPWTGHPPQTAVSWPHQCRPHPPTQWEDSSSPLHLSHRVSRQRRANLLQSILIYS